MNILSLIAAIIGGFGIGLVIGNAFGFRCGVYASRNQVNKLLDEVRDGFHQFFNSLDLTQQQQEKVYEWEIQHGLSNEEEKDKAWQETDGHPKG